MRTYRVMKALLGLFIVGMAVATLFVAALRVQAAFAGPSKATVTRAYFKQSVRGQVARFRDAAVTIRAQRRELRKLRRQVQAVRQSPYGTHPDERNALCVHGGEGAWTSNTGNGYYGGMQMDRQFQKTYAPWAYEAYGTADRWPISVQIAASLQAVHSGRRWNPWPTTARACGLI